MMRLVQGFWLSYILLIISIIVTIIIIKPISIHQFHEYLFLGLLVGVMIVFIGFGFVDYHALRESDAWWLLFLIVIVLVLPLLLIVYLVTLQSDCRTFGHDLHHHLVASNKQLIPF